MEVFLALALGAVLGFLAGGARVTAQVQRGRLVRKAGAALAPLLPDAGPSRSLADIFANRIRVRLGGITYELPVLSRGANRRWLDALEGRLGAVASAYQAAADDPSQIVPLLLSESQAGYELLLTYDESHVLPPLAEVDTFTDAEILRAVMEVWQAANPKAAADLLARATSSNSPASSTSSPASTAGTPASSSTA